MHSEDEDEDTETVCETCGYLVEKEHLVRHLNIWEDQPEAKHLEMENSLQGSIEPKLRVGRLDNNNQIQDISAEINDSVKDVPNKKLFNPITRTILQGVYDDSSPLSKLRGIPHVIQIITEYMKEYWKSHIQVGMFNVEGTKRRYTPHIGQFAIKLDEQSVYSWRGDGYVMFPEPQDVNINMMPFIMATSFEDSFLPEYLRSYFDKLIVEGILEHRKDIMGEEMGKVCYLSIQESWTEENSSQRRSGIHTESPGKLLAKNHGNIKEVIEGNDIIEEIENIELTADKDQKLEEQKEKQEYLEKGNGSSKKFYGIHGWGISMGYLVGGIYMASTVKNSCKVWDCRILPDEGEEGDIIGEHGDISHLVHYLPEGHPMQENVMYWITDRTPHESLPLDRRTYRQWFRIVTSRVSLWFKDHSTLNPNGVVPDPELTKIVKGSKFDKKELTIA